MPGTVDLRLLELKRAAEISADRAGLIACGDVETALRAMLKVASGLDERLLEVDVSDYIRQISELRETAGDERLWYSTHPPFPVRVRAVLRFDSVIRQMVARSDVAEVIRGVDDDVQRDLRAVTASGSRDEAMRHVSEKAASSWRNLEDAPLVALETFHELRARLAATGVAFGDACDAS